MKRKLKTIKRWLRRPFEWLAIVLAAAVAMPLPRRALLALCDAVSAVGCFLDRAGRKMAMANLKAIYGRDLPPRTANLIIRRAYRNMARTLAHVFWTATGSAKRIAAAGELSSAAVETLAAHRPVITVSGHFGCWEILSQLVQAHGIPITSVFKRIGSEGMSKLLLASRRASGQSIVPAEGALPPLMAALKEGNAVGLLVDQAVSPKNGGVWIRFFGVPMCVSAAPAFLAAKAKAPIAVAWSRPLKDGRYRCEVLRVIEWKKGMNIWAVTQEIAREFERLVRRHPDAWALNYNVFRKHPKPPELEQLLEREARYADSLIV